MQMPLSLHLSSQKNTLWKQLDNHHIGFVQVDFEHMDLSMAYVVERKWLINDAIDLVNEWSQHCYRIIIASARNCGMKSFCDMTISIKNIPKTQKWVREPEERRKSTPMMDTPEHSLDTISGHLEAIFQ